MPLWQETPRGKSGALSDEGSIVDFGKPLLRCRAELRALLSYSATAVGGFPHQSKPWLIAPSACLVWELAIANRGSFPCGGRLGCDRNRYNLGRLALHLVPASALVDLVALYGSFLVVISLQVVEHVCAPRDHGYTKFWSNPGLPTLLKENSFEGVRLLRVGRLPPLATSMIAPPA